LDAVVTPDFKGEVITPLKRSVSSRSEPDFGSGQKLAILTHPAQMQLQPKFSQISVFG
jgi:hypothetical protein